MRTAAKVGGTPMSKASPICFKYRGRVLALSPETSLKIRKIAEDGGKSVDSVLSTLLEKAQCVGNSLFLPARC